jgi:signal transduction histidine kinase
LILGLDLIERSADEPEKVIEGIAKLEGIVSGVMENLHRIAINLRPATLDHLGLSDSLRQYLQGFAELHPIEVHFETFGVEERLSEEVEVAVYRIAQEALTNVFRHAQATRVDVLLEKTNAKLCLNIQDNGVGFNAKTRLKHGGMGLVGMQERASMLGGQMVINSTPGQGTSLWIEVPCTEEILARREPS